MVKCIERATLWWRNGVSVIKKHSPRRANSTKKLMWLNSIQMLVENIS
jgi:hypothetical protein